MVIRVALGEVIAGGAARGCGTTAIATADEACMVVGIGKDQAKINNYIGTTHQATDLPTKALSFLRFCSTDGSQGCFNANCWADSGSQCKRRRAITNRKANYLDPNLNTADNSLFEQFYRTSVMEANRMERANVRCREVQHRSNNLKKVQ